MNIAQCSTTAQVGCEHEGCNASIQIYRTTVLLIEAATTSTDVFDKVDNFLICVYNGCYGYMFIRLPWIPVCKAAKDAFYTAATDTSDSNAAI